MLKITIPGAPIPKHRPRFSKKGYAYNDQKRESQIISMIIRSQSNLTEPYNIPIHLDITFFMPIPKSLSLKKQKELDCKPHIKKIDIDNLLKFYLDCLVTAGNVIKDDAIICQIHAIKIYSQQPRTEINISPF